MGALARLRTRCGPLALAVLSAGCESLPQKVSVDFAPLPVHRPAPATASAHAPTGSLFQTASYRPAFEDLRARMVGDTVSIQITENITASQKSSSCGYQLNSHFTRPYSVRIFTARDISTSSITSENGRPFFAVLTAAGSLDSLGDIDMLLSIFDVFR